MLWAILVELVLGPLWFDKDSVANVSSPHGSLGSVYSFSFIFIVRNQRKESGYYDADASFPCQAGCERVMHVFTT